MIAKKQRFDEAVRFVGERVNGYKLVAKESSRPMRFLNVVMPFLGMRAFKDYVTTIGSTTYMPQALIDECAWDVVYHEGYHAVNASFRHAVQYLMPQALAPAGILLMLLLGYGWWALMALILLGPLPSPWRMEEEERAYMVSLAVAEWYTQQKPSYLIEPVVYEFVGASYYFMWPFKSALTDVFTSWVALDKGRDNVMTIDRSHNFNGYLHAVWSSMMAVENKS